MDGVASVIVVPMSSDVLSVIRRRSCRLSFASSSRTAVAVERSRGSPVAKDGRLGATGGSKVGGAMQDAILF